MTKFALIVIAFLYALAFAAPASSGDFLLFNNMIAVEAATKKAPKDEKKADEKKAPEKKSEAAPSQVAGGKRANDKKDEKGG